MSDAQPPHPLSDKDFREGRSLFLEDWATLVLPNNEAARKSIEHSVTYGSTALQTSYILNGGALAALPALLTSLTKASVASIAWAAVPFVVGIVSAAISSLSAYLNFQWHAQISFVDANNHAAMLRRFYQKAEIADIDPAERVKWERRVNRSFYVGLAAALVSLFAFITGSGIFIWLAVTSGR